MTDLATMIWKEIAEFVGNSRGFRVFWIAVLLFGILPALGIHGLRATAGAGAQIPSLATLFLVLFSALIVVTNTGPDLVLHERVGHTLDYLLATRMPDTAIYVAKVLVVAAIGYVAALAAAALQLTAVAVFSGAGWHWLYLGVPQGRIIAFGVTAGLALYGAVVGTFAALRLGDQRSSYLVSMLSMGVFALPLLLGWTSISTTSVWLGHAAVVIAAWAVLVGLVGARLFRREMLVLYLQD